MKFMCNVIVDSEIADRMTEADWAIMGEQSMAYDRQLMDRGVFIAAEALVGTHAARTVRVRQGAAMFTDGPFAESKEVIAGFILIDVPDIDAAIEVARNIPMATVGAVEVRPVMVF